MLGFAINFDLCVVDDFLSSTAFCTLCYCMKDFLGLIHLFCVLVPVSLTQCTGYRVLLATIHQSSCLGSKGSKFMARNRTRDTSDLGLFFLELKGVTRYPCPRYHAHPFLVHKRAGVRSTAHAVVSMVLRI